MPTYCRRRSTNGTCKVVEAGVTRQDRQTEPDVSCVVHFGVHLDTYMRKRVHVNVHGHVHV